MQMQRRMPSAAAPLPAPPINEEDVEALQLLYPEVREVSFKFLFS